MPEIHEIGEQPRKMIFLRKEYFSLVISIVWIVVFVIVAWLINYLSTPPIGIKTALIDNYVLWFKDFGNLFGSSNQVYVESQGIVSIYQPLLNKWYFFFITGGLIALIINLIIFLIKMIFFRNKSKTNAALEIAKPLLKENPVITQEADIREKQKEENIEKISEWLGEGFRFLAEHNLEEAELIYKNLIKEYRKEFDEYGILQKRILSFYEEILAERREQENKK